MTAVEMRRLRPSDLPAIEAIERRCYATPWSRSMFAGEIAKPGGVCLGAFQDGRMVGYLICSRYDTVWHIMNVAVDPSRRRHGIATALLNRVLERVETDAQLTLEVRRSNAGAITLYERFGFRSAGVRRRYYADNGEDAIVMWRTPATLRGTLDDVPGT